MDPYLIALIVSYQIDDIDDSLISSFSDSQKRYLVSLLDNKEERLLGSIKNGHLEKVKLFFPFASHPSRYLHKAVVCGHLEIVKWIYDKIKDISEFKGFSTVIYRGDIEMVKLLISYGVDLNRQYTSPSFFMLLHQEFDMEYTENEDDSRETPLESAVITKNLPMMRLLIEKGAQVSYDRYSAVVTAIKHNNLEALKELIEHVHDFIIVSGEFDVMNEKIMNIFLDKILRNRECTEMIVRNGIVYENITLLRKVLRKGYIPSGKHLTFAIRKEAWGCATLLYQRGVSTEGVSWIDYLRLCLAPIESDL